MAAPQIGLGLGPVPSTVGLKQITVDPTGMTGFSSTALFVHGIAVGRPAYYDLPDILSRLGIYPTNWVTAATNKSKYKLRIDQGTGTYFDIPDLSKTWQELGVKEGHTIRLADAP